jgi:hypothetical protein
VIQIAAGVVQIGQRVVQRHLAMKTPLAHSLRQRLLDQRNGCCRLTVISIDQRQVVERRRQHA